MKKLWQRFVDALGEEMSTVMRISMYCVAAYLWLIGLFAPISEWTRLGPWYFYKLWQKLVFAVGCFAGGFGFFRFGRSFTTTSERARRIRAIA